jgi:hypothetical protein
VNGLKIGEDCGGVRGAAQEFTSECSFRRPKYYKDNFKKGGKDGMGLYRAVLISGGPGIGKTTSAHLMAKMKGYEPIELNASDARSKKLVEVRRAITFSVVSPANCLLCASERYQC